MNKKPLSISEKVKTLRENLGYSQEYMADMLKVSQQTYSLIEKKPEKSNLLRIQKIATILDVKISFLLNEEDAFNLYSFHQKGGSTASYIQNNTHQELNEEIVNQLKEEIKYLRKIIDNKINLS
ncbi:helix-turn-helix domain-containing protein [Brumimicrobium oceani]|uniref:XRE family transcriptional regulator n=1 Tax=Brumimicrobium oceani TaxID=2100725 RepID=A0A2U2XD88_9FLAO|nr:helix-turn-helix transcriptional regulator [Brumimicrobium oceani]PWH85765.1 XRE family transcriptional regulator [Brumimicrobium oceani]